MAPESSSPSIHDALTLPSVLTTSSTPHYSRLSPSAMPSLFRRPRPSDAPDVVYPSSLSTLYQGHALWYLEPHETGEPQIGDVGYMSEGAFIRLFNLDSSIPEQQVAFWDPPFKPTVPLDPGVFKPLDKRKALDPGHYPSHGVYQLTLGGGLDVTAGPYASIGLNVEHTCVESQGAVLVIKSPALRESVFKREQLQQYMRAHYREWCDYAKITLGHTVEREDISLITGWAKTSADWKAVAFTRSNTSSQVLLEAHAAGTVNANVHGERSRKTVPPVMHREGKLYAGASASSSASSRLQLPSEHPKPKPSSKRRKRANASNESNRAALAGSSKPENTSSISDPGRPTSSDGSERRKDQCAFLRRCMIKERLLFTSIVAGAGPHRLPMQDDGRSGHAGEGLMVEQEDEEDYEEGLLNYASEGMIADPLSTLLEYIFEVSDADTAVASDDDIESLVWEEQVIDFAAYLHRVQPPVKIEGTAGSIFIPEMISRDRKRAVARRAIAPTDIYKWPNLSFDGAGSLGTGKVFIGSIDPDARPLEFDHLVFTDSSRGSFNCRCFALSPDGTLLAASFDTTTALVWRLSDGLLVQRLQDQGHTNLILSVVFSPDTRHLVSGSLDKTTIIWDIKSGRALLQLQGHRDAARTIAYSPDGSRIATGSDDRSVKIWDASSGACLHSLNLGERVHKVIFSPNSARLAAKLSNTGAICDVQSGTRITTLQHKGSERMRLSLSQQGDRVITGTQDGTAKIWSAVTGEELLELNDHMHMINCVAFSPDGAEVATVSDDRAVVICDSWTGLRRRVYRLSSAARSVVYSPKGEYIAMDDAGGRVRVCDARSGGFVAEFEGHTAPVEELQFLPDGRSLLSHSYINKTVRLWSIRDMMRLH